MVTFLTHDSRLFDRRQNSHVTHFWSWSKRGKLQYGIVVTFLSDFNFFRFHILANIEANVLVQCNTIQLHNKKHFNVQDVSIDFQIGHASVYLSDLFAGDSELGNMHIYITDDCNLF